MTRPALNLKPSGVASVELVQGPSTHRRVYYQQTDGYIYEAVVSATSSEQDSSPEPRSTRLVMAWQGTQLAATVSSDGAVIRLYYLNTDGALSEYAIGGQASVLPGTPLHSTSIAAIQRTVGPITETLVFAQSVDLNIYAVTRSAIDASWIVAPKVNTVDVYPATGIAAVALGDDSPNPVIPEFRVYYTSRRQRLVELAQAGGSWPESALDDPVPGMSGLAATKRSNIGPDANRTFVYFFNSSGVISRAVPHGSGATVVHPAGIVGWNNALAGIFLSRAEDTRIYFQLAKDYNFSELTIRLGDAVLTSLPF